MAQSVLAADSSTSPHEISKGSVTEDLSEVIKDGNQSRPILSNTASPPKASEKQSSLSLRGLTLLCGQVPCRTNWRRRSVSPPSSLPDAHSHERPAAAVRIAGLDCAYDALLAAGEDVDVAQKNHLSAAEAEDLLQQLYSEQASVLKGLESVGRSEAHNRGQQALDTLCREVYNSCSDRESAYERQREALDAYDEAARQFNIAIMFALGDRGATSYLHSQYEVSPTLPDAPDVRAARDLVRALVHSQTRQCRPENSAPTKHTFQVGINHATSEWESRRKHQGQVTSDSTGELQPPPTKRRRSVSAQDVVR